jgi:flavodoxin
MNLIQIAGIVLGVIIGVIVISFLVINLDLASVLATGSETLTPIGSPVGRAIVIYSPGLSGATKDVASRVASKLVALGYTVELAGVKSSAAASSTNYDVVVVGGPMYFGKLSSSTADYLGKLSLKNGAKLGVFGTTGTDKFMEVDFNTVSAQVSSLRAGENMAIKLVLTNEVDADCAALVSNIFS